MMARAMEGRLYGYEGISGKIYRIRLDKLERIVRARNVRFIEEPINDDVKEDHEDPIYEATFKDDAFITKTDTVVGI